MKLELGMQGWLVCNDSWSFFCVCFGVENPPVRTWFK